MPPPVPPAPHVVHIAATANGAAWMHQQLVALRARGYRTTAVIAGRGGSLAARLEADGIPFHVLDLDVLSSRNAWAAARKLVDLVTLLRRLRPDVVQCHLFPSILLGRLSAWLADVPVRVSMIPGPYYLEAPVLRDLDIRTAPLDTRVVASCEYTRTLYTRGGVEPSHVDLIYYGQDAAEFDPDTANGLRVRRELGIGPHTPVVGDVAYFYPPLPPGPFTPPHLVGRGIKAHDVLIKAVPRVLERVPDALFVLVGEGWGAEGAAYQATLRQLAEELGVASAVRFVGRREDIPDTLSAFDVSVQCSLNENLGGSIESLLMQRPLVASDVGGLPDAVRHERTGLLVPPDDPAALADAIVRLLLDRPLAQRLAAAGRAYAREQLTLERTVRELDALYRRALTGVAAQGPASRRGYRLSRTAWRAVHLAPWAWTQLLTPVRRALRPAPPATRTVPPPAARDRATSPPRLRIVQMAGGTDNGDWLVSICKGLRAEGHFVSAIIGWPERSLAARLRDAGIPYGAMELSFAPGRGKLRLLVYALRLPVAVLRLAYQLRRGGTEVLHTHIFNTIFIGRLAGWLAGVPMRVSMVPGPLHLEAPFTRIADRLTCWMDHRVVAGSEATRRLYADMGLRPPRLQMVRYGADTARFTPERGNGVRVRRELGLSPDAPVIGMVAWFYPPRSDWQTPPHVRGRGMKGHDDFLAAAEIVRTRHPGARFVLVGGGWGDAGERYRQRLMSDAAARGLRDAALFVGHRDDIPDMLAAMDVAVQCSLTENYGGTIEALLMKRPVVATRVGGMPETVRHRETGLLVPPSSPAALADAICYLLEHPDEARGMAEAGHMLMREQFDIALTATNIAALYRDLQERRP